MARNKLVEICRFLFCTIVLMVHTNGLRPMSKIDYPFAGGYIVVEFFLIISGFFASNYAMNELQSKNTPGESAIYYTLKQYIKIFPIVAVCVLMQYIVSNFYHKLALSNFPYCIYEILLLPQTGIYKTFLNLPLWYLSAYFICLPLLIFLLRKYKDGFYYIGSIIIPLLIYGFICRTHIHLDIWSFKSKILFIGLFRTFAGLCIGVCSYRIFCILQIIKFTDIGRRLIKTVAVIVFFSVIGYIYLVSFTYADYFLVFIMMFVIAYINTINFNNSKLNEICIWLGNFSVYVYCSHWVIRDIIPRIMLHSTYNQMVPVYLVSAFIYAYIIKIVVGRIRKVCNWIWRKCIYDSKI